MISVDHKRVFGVLPRSRSFQKGGIREGTMTRPVEGSAKLPPAGPPTDFRRPVRSITRATVIFLALGAIWRVARFAACPPLWGDEAFIAVNLLGRDFAGMFRTLDYYQIVPLGFLWAELAVVRTLGGSEWAVRLIPFLAGLLSLGLFGRFAVQTVDRRTALLAIAVFAASFYPVRHATEVKPYSTDLLLALGATILAWSIRRDVLAWRRWCALTLIVGLGVWFSYPLVLVAVGLGMFLAGRVVKVPHPRAVLGFSVFGGLTSMSWLASYLTFGRPQSQSAPFYSKLETWRGAFPPLGRPWELPGWLLDVHTGNMLAYPHGGNHYASVLTACLVLLGSVRLWRTRRDLLVLFLSPIPPMFLASCFHLYPYGTSARTTLFLAPAFCLLAGAGAMSLIRRRSVEGRRRWVRFAAIGLGVIPLVGSLANVIQPYKNWEDTLNRRAVEALAAMAQPGDRWLVTDGLDARLESRQAILEHWVQQVAEVKYNILADAPVPTRWLPDPLAVASAARSGRTWLIVHRTGCPNFDEARLFAAKRRLEQALGSPRVFEYKLTRGETITAYHFARSFLKTRPTPALGGNWAVGYDGSSRPASR